MAAISSSGSSPARTSVTRTLTASAAAAQGFSPVMGAGGQHLLEPELLLGV